MGRNELAQKPIAHISLDLNRIHKWDGSNGDTWDPFWADDGALYTFNCDGRGFGATAMNLAFTKLSGEDPDALVGSQVNAMSDFGKSGQKGRDNATWKACGQECIDGVFSSRLSSLLSEHLRKRQPRSTHSPDGQECQPYQVD